MLCTGFAPQLAFAEEADTSSAAVTPVPTETSIAPTDVPQTDHSDTVTKTEVTEALTTIPEILAASEEVAVTRDVDSAAIVTTGETTVDIPKDPAEGVTLAMEGVSIDIQLPNADEAKDASTVAPGVVAYAASNGSANAVQADDSGAVRMLTIIDNADAPTEYPYTVTVPDGGRVELTFEGGALIVDGEGQAIAVVETPWAKDAAGKELRTWFTTDGQVLMQHIEHTVEGVVYPVTADPRFAFTGYGPTIFLSKNETYYVSIGLAAGIGSYFGGLGAFLSTSLGTAAADWARDHNQCLAVYKPLFLRGVRSFSYRCQ
ncbi:MAG: hypothetical protein A3F54_02880 [Candidatus Kerfeldbacteria bacterium RIFCSPHIGHO2_12_FULL_48_17]|uniref:Uncharacterized protein n=1 Tax=Candidatus Kerfeldbacteria bacterium RIFCSPHIGHO2_12_FULL_48_17 TaxID=1798542 RepID=A0A1G2B887_9BACT|nr:MAG: hypothetical protein A3F54_02880 [Candidatus Kerfeldbacteria bacterium RIFCSPHIGHO2_12_FULL_48_17]